MRSATPYRPYRQRFGAQDGKTFKMSTLWRIWSSSQTASTFRASTLLPAVFGNKTYKLMTNTEFSTCKKSLWHCDCVVPYVTFHFGFFFFSCLFPFVHYMCQYEKKSKKNVSRSCKKIKRHANHIVLYVFFLEVAYSLKNMVLPSAWDLTS